MTLDELLGLVSRGPFSHTTAEVSPQVAPQHRIHWVLAKEVYATARRPNIEGWLLVVSKLDTCIYVMADQAIVSFRGSFSPLDITADIQLATPGQESNVAKIGPAVELVAGFLSENPSTTIQTTGHSLGGAVARAVSQSLGLGCITFNGAAPPTNPVTNGPKECDYHIVFDIISAWSHPSTIRIDQNFRPINPFRNIPFIGTTLSPYFEFTAVAEILKAHSIDNFTRPGKIVSNEDETFIMQHWFHRLPSFFQVIFLRLTHNNHLPAVDGP
jgi:hypothetical protein